MRRSITDMHHSHSMKLRNAGILLENVDQENSSDESESDSDDMSEMSSDAGGSQYEGITDQQQKKKRKSKKKKASANAMPFALSKNKHRNDDLFVFKQADYDNVQRTQSVLTSSRRDTVMDVDFRSEDQKKEEEENKLRPRMAINSDTESADDSDEDEELRLAKASIYSRNLSRKVVSSDEDDFKSESDY